MTAHFQAGGALPARHKTYVERQGDEDALGAALNNDYLHVLAPRQLGKTSLLQRLALKLREIGWRTSYVDLSMLMGLTNAEWYQALGKVLATSLTPNLQPDISNQIHLRNYLLYEALPLPNSQARIAILLDEVEGILRVGEQEDRLFSDSFFSTLRSIYNQRDEFSGSIVVAFAGAVNPAALVKDPTISPFNVGQDISLEDFSREQLLLLSRQLLELRPQVDEAAHEAIYDWTRGHPYLSQRICAEIDRHAHQNSTLDLSRDEVDRIVEDVFLYPDNPLKVDKNIRHTMKMLAALSLSAADFWRQIQHGQSVPKSQLTDDIFVELYLTGAIRVQDGIISVRNRIYEVALSSSSSQAGDPSAAHVSAPTTSSNTPIRVFLSSTWLDLQEERQAVEKALQRLHDTAFNGMEYFGSRPDTPMDVSLAEVERSQVYVGIFAHRYGSGITEAEYREAIKNEHVCLIYLKDDDVPIHLTHMEHDPAKAERLRSLKKELKARHTISYFKNPDQLATQVVTDLHNQLGTAPTVRPKQISNQPLDPSRHTSPGPDTRTSRSAQVTNESSTPLKRGAVDSKSIRLKDIEDNINKDFALLKEYEDALRLEYDPRRRAQYTQEIEMLSRSASNYQREYSALLAAMSEQDMPVENSGLRLSEMDVKLDALLIGQKTIIGSLTELRATVLNHYNEKDEALIGTIVQHLDAQQLTVAQEALRIMEAGRISDTELRVTLQAVSKALAEITEQKSISVAPQIASTVRAVAEKIDAPDLNVAHRLKLSIPIIPLLLSYEGQFDLSSGINLGRAWRALLEKRQQKTIE